VGPTGKVARAAVLEAGLDPDQDVAWLNLARCRPEGDNFDTPQWGKAERRCIKGYLEADLAKLAGLPLVVLGRRPLQWVADEGKKTGIGSARGLWTHAQGREVFVARHPAQFLRDIEPLKTQRTLQFYQDMQRMADRVLGRERDAFTVEVYASAREAEKRLAWLATHGPWVFDIETYDARQVPSRKNVSTNPFHPDFRIRGIAFAWSPTEGCWVDLLNGHGTELLRPVFESNAEKGAFHGNFDQEGVEMAGLVPSLRCRTFDGMLAMVALSDGRHESLRLEKAVVDILGRTQYWVGVDKEFMRDLPVEQVARGAVGDACFTFELCVVLHDRLARGEYL
jgi:hypothetical protein